MFKLRFSNREVHTPLTTEQMIAQMEASKSEDEIETASLKAFTKDSKGYYLAHPQVELEPGVTSLVRKMRNLAVIRIFMRLVGGGRRQGRR